jgi:hypothetical protein
MCRHAARDPRDRIRLAVYREIHTDRRIRAVYDFPARTIPAMI